MPPILFPSRGFRRTRERATGLLFAFGTDDLSTTSASGHTITVSRTSTQTMLDTQGRVVTVAYGQPPFGAQYNSTEGVYEPGLACSGARTNLCWPSEDFGGWGAVGTPTRTAAARRIGELVLDLIGDNDAGALEGYTRPVTFTGNVVKMVSLHVAQGTSTSVGLRLRDTTAGANRLLGFITFSSGVPVATMTTGSYIGKTRMADGCYRLHFQTTSVTATNTNQIEIYPATTSGLTTTQTGDVYCGGVQAEDSGGPGGNYIKTVSTTIADATTDASAAVDFPPQNCTIYIRHATPHWASAALNVGPCTLLTIGTDSGSPTNALRLRYNYSAGWNLAGELWDNAGTSSTVNGTPAPAESTGDLVVQIDQATTAVRMRIDTGGGFTAYSTAAGPMGTAWSAGGIQIGDTQATGASFFGVIRRVVIASGARTLAEMRGLNV